MNPRQAHRPRRIRPDLLAIVLAPLGLLVVVLSQAAGGVAARALVHGPAALIVGGGTLGAVLVTFSPRGVWAALRAAVATFGHADDDLAPIVSTLAALATRAYRQGLLALERELDAIDDRFLRDGLALVIDGTDLATLRDVLGAEAAVRDADADMPARVFEAAAGYAPTLGILGAVLGLIQVMEHLAAPGTLGDGIAVAFTATVYGVGAANLILLPLAGRLRERAARDARRREVLIHGICAIGERWHPRLVARKLAPYADRAPRGAATASPPPGQPDAPWISA